MAGTEPKRDAGTKRGAASSSPPTNLTLHPRHGLAEALQTPIRFSIMAALDGAAEVEFGVLRDVLGASDSALSKALTLLAQLGFVTLRKGYVGTRPRTWVSALNAGRHAYREHVRALQAIVALGAGALDPALAPTDANPAAAAEPTADATRQLAASPRPAPPRGRTA